MPPAAPQVQGTLAVRPACPRKLARGEKVADTRGAHIVDSPWLIGVAAVLAGSVAAVSGFGMGSLLTPLLLLSMPANHAVAILAIPHAVATGIRWLRLRPAVHRPTFRQFGIASAA